VELLGTIFCYTGHQIDKPPPGSTRWLLGHVRGLGLDLPNSLGAGDPRPARGGSRRVSASTYVRIVDVERFIASARGYTEGSPAAVKLAEDLREEWTRAALERL
jgi:hypothetical protein